MRSSNSQMNKSGSQQYQKPDKKVKILLLGESHVGKSSILLRFVENKFNTNLLETLGIDYKQKYLQMGQFLVQVQVWDTAGMERFQNIPTTYYRNVDAVILTYDITSQESFERIQKWMEILQDNTDQSKTTIFLVGNKVDLEEKRQVQKQNAEDLAKNLLMTYYEASAKTDFNVQTIFENLTKQILISKKEATNDQLQNTAISLNQNQSQSNDKKGNNTGCCSKQ